MSKPISVRLLDGIEWVGNALPHPFWLFCWLVLGVAGVSAGLQAANVTVVGPETQLLTTQVDADRQPGQIFTVRQGQGLDVEMGGAAHSSRLNNLHLEIYEGGELFLERSIKRQELSSLVLSTQTIPTLAEGQTYEARIVNRATSVGVRSLLSRDGLTWFVLHMVENFSHFEPLGLVLVMLMGVAVAEGSGLIPTAMRAIALRVPDSLIIPVLFALGACGNIGSDAGIVVIPPLAAAVFKQMGKSPIAGLLVGYVGATAGFTANLLPAGTDVLAMSLTNAATGSNPEVNVFSNWYFMSVSVFFLAAIGTWVTNRYTLPRLKGVGLDGVTAETGEVSPVEGRALWVASITILVVAAIWLTTIIPDQGLLRHPDPDPALVWRSPFFKGLVPILFTLFAAGGIAYGLAAGTLERANDILTWMTESMQRMGGYIVLILVISQFIRMFQWANLDQVVAIGGADLLRVLGMEDYPVPFFIAFVIIVAIANMFMGSASAKWAIFAPIFAPMFMGLGLHPAFTQLLYRIGDSITNCVSPLYPFFPILLGWVAQIDEDRAKVGTLLSYLVPYAVALLVGWIVMLIGWYALGLPIGPDSPLRM